MPSLSRHRNRRGRRDVIDVYRRWTYVRVVGRSRRQGGGLSDGRCAASSVSTSTSRLVAWPAARPTSGNSKFAGVWIDGSVQGLRVKSASLHGGRWNAGCGALSSQTGVDDHGVEVSDDVETSSSACPMRPPGPRTGSATPETVSHVTPVIAHGDRRTSRGVIDVYRRISSVREGRRSRGQGHGRKERPYRTVAGNTSRPQQVPRSPDNGSRECGQNAGGRIGDEWTMSLGEVDKTPVGGELEQDDREQYPGSS